ncbi:MAG: carbohydrate-binding protein, partial [Planctomycetes bacterium]|nr:carbohydrate-binding protein [Planctomycetota bacterium]
MNTAKCIVVVCLAILLQGLPSEVATAADVYVSPHGRDSNTGGGPDENHALRTIQAGVNRLQPGDTLWIRGGVYRETVTFPRSGTLGKPITLRPYRNEKVVISGCDPIIGWVRQEGPVWKAPMPWTLGKGRNQVFAGGEVMIEARFPNEPDPGLEMYVSGLSPLWPTFGAFSIASPGENPGRITSKLLQGQPDDYWKGAIYYGVHYQGWCAQTGIIESSKSGEILVGDRTRTWWFPGRNLRYKPEEGRGMIVGHRHALDRPGEWHWEDNTLYLIPKGEGPPVDVEAKRRQVVLDLSGRQYIRVVGLHIHAASVRLENSAHCVFDGCDLSYISHFTRQYSIGQVEPDRDTVRSGETGIYVSGHDNAFLNCRVRYSAGAGFHIRGYHHTIHNCLIDEVSYTAHYLNAITDAVADFARYENQLVGGHVITFNTMRNAGRHFFNFYGNGTSQQSRDRAPMDYMATLFAHNHLYNGMLQTKDAGFLTGYYGSGGTLNGLNSQVVYNVLHDSYDIFAMRIHKLGIVYLDAGTCDVDLRNNLLWATPGSLQQGLWFNTACVDIHERNNLFHPNFERTSQQLRPEDFPGGRPFRFGHDFEHPPRVPKWPPLEGITIEAEACPKRSPGVTVTASTVDGCRDGQWLCFGEQDFDSGWQSAVLCFAGNGTEINTDRSARQPPRHTKRTDPLVFEAIRNDGLAPGVRRQWDFIHNVKDGAWVRYRDVPLGDGYQRVRVVYGCVESGERWMEVRLDAPDGPVVGRVDLVRTDRKRDDRIQIYSEALGRLAPDAQGRHDVYFVFRSADEQPVGEFTYFRFERYRGELPLQKNEVKLELRLDAPDGEAIGTF